MSLEIGEAAGKVWNFLNKKPQSTFDEIYKSLNLDPNLFCMAVGWLAREDKVAFEGEGKKTKFSLKNCADGSRY
jgi:hypothetical protein